MWLAEVPLAHIRRHWAVFAGLAVALVIWCTLDVSRRAIVDPQRPYLHMTDFTVYTEAGAAFFDGREPYEVVNIRGWKYIYPPLFALIVAPLSLLGPQQQAAAWFGISVLLCLGSYFECRRLLAEMLPDIGASRNAVAILSILAGATVLFPVLNCLQRGQVGVVLLYPLLVGFRIILLGQTRRDWFLGGLMLALPAVLKLTPLLPVGCVLLALAVASRSRGVVRTWKCPVWTSAGVVAGSILFALLVPAGLIGWSANLRHLHTWYARVATKVDHDRTDQFAGSGTSVRNQSLANSVYRFGNWASFQFADGPDDRLVDSNAPPLGTMPMDHPLVHHLLLAARALAALLLVVAVVLLGRQGDRLSLGFALGLACVATLVVSPVARGHYFLLWLPAVLFGGLWVGERISTRAAFAMASGPALLCLIHYAALSFAGRIGLLGIGTALWFGAACGIVLVELIRPLRGLPTSRVGASCGTDSNGAAQAGARLRSCSPAPS